MTDHDQNQRHTMRRLPTREQSQRRSSGNQTGRERLQEETTQQRHTEDRGTDDTSIGDMILRLVWWGRETPSEHAQRMNRTFAESRELTRRRELQGSRWRVFFASLGDQNVIYELERGRRRRTLTFLASRNRNYYRAGDVILPFRIEPRWMLKNYPELAVQQDDHKTLFQYIAMALGVGRDTYKMGWKIDQITVLNDGTGRGEVALRAVIFFSDTEIIELQYTRQGVSRSALHVEFENHPRMRIMQGMIPVMEFVAENLTTIAISGGRASLAKRAGRRAVRYALTRAGNAALRRLIVKIIRTLKGSAGTVVSKFSTELAKDLTKQYQRNQMRRRSGGDQRQTNLNYQAAVERAAAKAVTSLINNTLGRRLSRRIESSLREVQNIDPVIGATLPQRIEGFISREISEFFTKDLLNTIVRTATNTHAKLVQGEGEFSKVLQEEFKDVLVDHLESKIDGFAETLGEHILET